MCPALRESVARDLDPAGLLIRVGAVFDLRASMRSVDQEVDRGRYVAASARFDDHAGAWLPRAEGKSAGIGGRVPRSAPGNSAQIDGGKAATAPESKRALIGTGVKKVREEPFVMAFHPDLADPAVRDPVHIDSPVFPEIRADARLR